MSSVEMFSIQVCNPDCTRPPTPRTLNVEAERRASVSPAADFDGCRSGSVKRPVRSKRPSHADNVFGQKSKSENILIS